MAACSSSLSKISVHLKIGHLQISWFLNVCHDCPNENCRFRGIPHFNKAPKPQGQLCPFFAVPSGVIQRGWLEHPQHNYGGFFSWELIKLEDFPAMFHDTRGSTPAVFAKTIFLSARGTGLGVGRFTGAVEGALKVGLSCAKQRSSLDCQNMQRPSLAFSSSFLKFKMDQRRIPMKNSQVTMFGGFNSP